MSRSSIRPKASSPSASTPGVGLDRAGQVADVEEGGLAVAAPADHPAGDPVGELARARPPPAARGRGRRGSPRSCRGRGSRARVGVDPFRAQPLEPSPGARSSVEPCEGSALAGRSRSLMGPGRPSPARRRSSRCSVSASRSISRIAGPWWVSCSSASRQPLGVSAIRPRITPRPSSPQSPVHGDPRLAADLGRALEDRRVGDVGKVGDHQVDAPRRAVGDALADGDLERDAEPLGVLARCSRPPPARGPRR